MAQEVTIKPNELNLLANLQRNLIYGSINACKLYLETNEEYYELLALELDCEQDIVGENFSTKLMQIMKSVNENRKDVYLEEDR